MSEEVLTIGLISGIECKDGRHFQELVCVDSFNKEVRVVVPTVHECGETGKCEDCNRYNECEMQESYFIDIGRRLIIKRL